MSDSSLATTTSPKLPDNPIDGAWIDLAFAKQVLEAALLSATEPLGPATLRRLFEPDLGLSLIHISEPTRPY